MSEPPPKKRLTLYEDLLSEDILADLQARDAAKQAAANAKKAKDASLMFKPPNIGGNKKPQAKTTRKPGFSAMHKFSSSTSNAPAGPSEPSSDAPNAQSQPIPKQQRSYDDWIGNDDEMDFIYDQRNQKREVAKSKKRSKKNKMEEKIITYEDIYDPTTPVPLSGLNRSEVKYDSFAAMQLDIQKARNTELSKKGLGMDPPPGEDPSTQRPITGNKYKPRNVGIAPPASLTSHHAPAADSLSPSRALDNVSDSAGPQASYAPPPPAADIDMNETADQAYARRMAMSGQKSEPTSMRTAHDIPPPRPAPPTFVPASVVPSNLTPASVTPVAATSGLSAADAEKKAKVAAQIAALKARIGQQRASLLSSSPAQPTSTLVPSPAAAPSPSPAAAPSPSPPPAHSMPVPVPRRALLEDFPPAMSSGPTFNPNHPRHAALVKKYGSSAPPPVSGTTTISAAPVCNPEYLARQQKDTTQPGPQEQQAPAEQRTARPGQESFAERHMKKLGWEKGQGLGASGEGITTALKMQAQKRKRKPDAQGGGYVAPANMGKIVGGKKAKPNSGEGVTSGGELDGMSEVVKLSGMLENLDVEHEIAENNLLQEIGDDMGQEYGQVERLYIWQKKDGGNGEVFVKFTSPLSAVRCMKGMGGTLFAGNEVKAEYWDAALFEEGKYSLP